MRQLAIFSLLLFVACTQPFVMKVKEYSRPVMVGNVRHIGGQNEAHDKKYTFETEIEITDTPTSPSHDWYQTEQNKLDDKLLAASVLATRDLFIDEIAIGSYVFNLVLFYLDKDWIRVSGYSLPPLSQPPQRQYILKDPRPKIAESTYDSRKSKYRKKERVRKKRAERKKIRRRRR
ncbi:MAG: hypothetical protein NZL89_06915 [Leptospiraceae bacterium]|nr:hypothetical protein [Leptospiraceae bacterium]